MVAKQSGHCQFQRGCPACANASVRSGLRPRPDLRVRGSLPEVFHTCGKNCGKPGVYGPFDHADRRCYWYLAMAKGLTPICHAGAAVTFE